MSLDEIMGVTFVFCFAAFLYALVTIHPPEQ